jgi:glyoxylase-like metal-dependent hydrolase (beta-lactamase superfamily II)
MFTGDTILGRGTTVVAWPDGDLGAYLTSLGRLTAYEGVLMLPGHGPAPGRLRRGRSGLSGAPPGAGSPQVRAAMAAGADSPEAIVAAVYPDIAANVRFAAVWSARAQLVYLRRESQPTPEQLDPL